MAADLQQNGKLNACRVTLKCCLKYTVGFILLPQLSQAAVATNKGL